MRTVADEAKAINKQYDSNSLSDLNTKKRLLDRLFQKQEQYKQQMGIGQERNEFEGGGWSNTFKDSNPFQVQDIPSFDEARLMPYSGDPGERVWENPSKLAMGDYSKTPETEFGYYNRVDHTPSKWDKAREHMNTNSEKYLRMGSNIISGLGNMRNMFDVSDPRRIDPTRVNPTGKANFMDLNPFKIALANELATTRSGYLQAGADFDTASSGINKANAKFAQGLGNIHVQQQQLDNKMVARLDAIQNKGMYYNAEKDSQADIDLAQREDIAEQKKRDYFAALTKDASDIFGDEADRLYAERLEPYLSTLSAAEQLKLTIPT